MPAVRFRGGPMDGAERELPAGAETASTPARGGSSSHYVLDDDTAVFTGFDDQGAIMAGLISHFRGEERRDREALEAAMRPKSCGRCGRTFGDAAAWTVHFESGEGSRCLPGDAYGQLTERDGVWVRPGSDAAR